MYSSEQRSEEAEVRKTVHFVQLFLITQSHFNRDNSGGKDIAVHAGVALFPQCSCRPKKREAVEAA